MPVMDEFREEREAIKNASPKEKWDYFWEYYKWYVIGGAIIIFLLVIFIRDMVNKKDWIFYGAIINSYAYEEQSEALLNDFVNLAQLDTENHAVMFDTSYSITRGSYDEISNSAAQKLLVNLTAADLDFVIADETTFGQYATIDTFMDMRTLFTGEDLKKYEPYFYYVDMEDVRKIDEANLSASYDSYQGAEYDHTSPEGLAEPIPVAIYIGSSEKLNNAYVFKEEAVVLGVPQNTQHLQTTLQFIDYLLEDRIEE